MLLPPFGGVATFVGTQEVAMSFLEIEAPDLGVIAPVTTPDKADWSQFHGDPLNRGTRDVTTGFALHPLWSIDIGPVLYSSPVIGLDGTIYVGNVKGRLIAVNPDGSQRWDVRLGGALVSSPAIADDGSVYIVVTEVRADESMGGQIVRVGPDGTLLNARGLPARHFTTSSPKIWASNKGTHIFLLTRHPQTTQSSNLLVFDQELRLVEQVDLSCAILVGSSAFSLKDLWEFLSSIQPTFDESNPTPYRPLFERFGWLEPTVAISELPGITTQSQPVVFAGSPCEYRAFHWKPPVLEPLWTQEQTMTLTSSPAVLGDGSVIVVGRQDGKVLGYDPRTGNKRWTYDAEEAVMATPAGIGTRVYVASLHRLHVLDIVTGALVAETRLRSGETVASPAVSSTHVYVSTAYTDFDSGLPYGRELISFSHDLTKRGHDLEGGCGVTSPSIGSDGTLYAVASDADRSFLRAYAPPEP